MYTRICTVDIILCRQQTMTSSLFARWQAMQANCNALYHSVAICCRCRYHPYRKGLPWHIHWCKNIVSNNETLRFIMFKRFSQGCYRLKSFNRDSDVFLSIDHSIMLAVANPDPDPNPRFLNGTFTTTDTVNCKNFANTWFRHPLQKNTMTPRRWRFL